MRREIVFLLWIVCAGISAQDIYNVNVEDRNLALELNAKAKQFIDEQKNDLALNNLLQSIKVDSVLRESYILVYRAWLIDKINTDTVIDLINKGKRIFHDDDELCFYTAEMYRMMSKIPEAILEYTLAVNFASRNGEDFYLVHYYYFNRANCLQKMEMYDGALVDYNYTLKLKPDFAVAFYNRGVCYYRQGNKDAACSDWNQALAMGYDSAKSFLDKYCSEKD